MLKNVIQFIIDIFKFHKMKIATILIAAVVFLVLLFPFADLNDLVTEKIYEATNKQVFISFEQLNLSLLPAPGLEMAEVKLNLKNIPGFKIKKLALAPSIASLLAFNLGFSSSFEGLLGGDVQLTLKPGEKTGKIQKQNIELEAENINLAQISKFTKSPFNLKGKVNIDATADIDPSFSEQPDGEASITTQQLIIPATNVPTNFGELPLPELNFSSLIFKGRLTAGDLILEQLKLGAGKDALLVRVKGRLGLKLLKLPSGIAPRPGAFDLKLEITSQASKNKDLQLFLSFLDKFKTSNNGKDSYTLRIKGARFGAAPQMTKLTSFE